MRKIISLLIALCFLGFLACNEKIKVRIPEQYVMPFPFTMAKNGKFLLVSSISADMKYDFGRLVTLDTDAIKLAIDNHNSSLDWKKFVTSNVLIPREVSELSFSNDFVVFASRENKELIALPVLNEKPDCNAPFEEAKLCKNAKIITLADYNPFSLKAVADNSNEELLLVSYLSSDRIDLIKIDKKSSKNMEVLKSFYAFEWVKNKVLAKSLKNQRLIVRKIEIAFKDDMSKSKVYFLLEQHPKKDNNLAKAKAAYILAIKVSDLLDSTTNKTIDFLDLKKEFSIDRAQDFYIDAEKNIAYVLAPEGLYKIKIDLPQKSLLKTSNIMCTGSTSMAVSALNDLIVIPCLKDNRVLSFSLSSLSLKATSKIVGRGPSFVVIDDKNSLIYCSFSDDGIVAIFDYELNFLGHVFEKAPIDRVGS